MALRPCLDCGILTDRGRCSRCQRPRERQRTRAKRATRPYTYAEKQRRAAAVTAWRTDHGDTCPGYGVPPHPSHDLTADHVTPVAAGGAEDGPLTVLCRSCNSRKRDGRGPGGTRTT